MRDIINQNAYLTQAEVAEYFRVCEGTVINWRKRGILTYLRLEGSNKPLYPKEEIEKLVKQFTVPKKEEVKKTNKPETKRNKPEISSEPEKEWRI